MSALNEGQEQNELIPLSDSVLDLLDLLISTHDAEQLEDFAAAPSVEPTSSLMQEMAEGPLVGGHTNESVEEPIEEPAEELIQDQVNEVTQETLNNLPPTPPLSPLISPPRYDPTFPYHSHYIQTTYTNNYAHSPSSPNPLDDTIPPRDPKDRIVTSVSITTEPVEIATLRWHRRTDAYRPALGLPLSLTQARQVYDVQLVRLEDIKQRIEDTMMVYGGMWGWKELVKELREVGLGIEELIRKLAVMLRNLGEEVVVEWVEWEKIWEEDREARGR